MNNFPSNIKAYRPVTLCGRGAYGSVYLVSDAVGARYALKIVEKNVIGGSWEREFRGLKHYKTQLAEHPNLIKIFHIEDCGDFFYYTMEAADNLKDGNGYYPATLANLIRKRGSLPADLLRKTFNSLLDGLEHLHNAKVIHRDIKPDNIIFVKGVPKFSDIGLLDTTTHTLSLAGTQDFVPPEYLLGRRKEPTVEIDLYALGKTLYCAFTGSEANQFPIVSPELLKQPEYRIFNKLVQAACTPERSLRLKSITAFRKALNGEIGWGYEFRRFLFTVLVLPIFLMIRLILFLFSRKWVLFLLLFLFLIWFGLVIKRYWQLEKEMYPWDMAIHPSAFKRALKEWHVQVGKYDLYDFQQKNKLSIKLYGERHLVTREEYLQAKQPGIPQESIGLAIEIGFPEDKDFIQQKAGVKLRQADITQNTPLKREYLHEKVFDKISGNDLQPPYGTRWEDQVMILPPTAGSSLKYRPELPLISEVNLAFDPAQISGSLNLVLTAAEYVPLPNRKIPDAQWRRQMRFPLKISGKEILFDNAMYRDQDKSEDELLVLSKPNLKSLSHEGRFCKLRIITADGYCRVYFNDCLIWGSFLPFYGGYFEMRYKTDKALKIGHFSVYNAGIVQPGEKRKSRLKLPKTPPPLLKKEKKAPPVSSPRPLKIHSSEPVSRVVQTPAVKPPPKSNNPPVSVETKKNSEKKTEAIPPAVKPPPQSNNPPVSAETKKKPEKKAEAVPPAVIPKSSKTAKSPQEKQNKVRPKKRQSPRRKIVRKEYKAPQKKPAKELTQSEYKYVQSQVVECIAKLDELKKVVPDYKNIPAEEVVIDCFFEHEKGGNVYEFRIPSRKIRAKFRIQDVGFMVFRGFLDFYVDDRAVEF